MQDEEYQRKDPESGGSPVPDLAVLAKKYGAVGAICVFIRESPAEDEVLADYVGWDVSLPHEVLAAKIILGNVMLEEEGDKSVVRIIINAIIKQAVDILSPLADMLMAVQQKSGGHSGVHVHRTKQ